MDNIQISWIAQIAAAQARIAGMEAENAFRKETGSSPAYAASEFFSEAAGLEHIAEAARNYP